MIMIKDKKILTSAISHPLLTSQIFTMRIFKQTKEEKQIKLPMISKISVLSIKFNQKITILMISSKNEHFTG